VVHPAEVQVHEHAYAQVGHGDRRCRAVFHRFGWVLCGSPLCHYV
jgi:hypothetical protein